MRLPGVFVLEVCDETHLSKSGAPFQIMANFSCLFVVISGNLFVESFISFVNTIGGA
jgi:hypothetical protein